MNELMETEAVVLDRIEADLAPKGYTITRKPQRSELPDFLQDFQPDAIAVGAHPNYVIEVVHGNQGRIADRKKVLQKRFEEHSDWKLIVQYVPIRETLEPVNRARVETTLKQAKAISETEKQGAFLLGWAALEAATRRLEPTLAGRPSQYGGIANLLVSQGYFTQENGMRLRELGKLRNEITHGALDRVPSAEQVDELLAFGDQLLAHQDGDPIAAE